MKTTHRQFLVNRGTSRKQFPVKASKCEFDLTIAGLKALKTASIPDPIISAMLASQKAAATPTERTETSSAKATTDQYSQLPEFYGMYAFTPSGLAELKMGGPALPMETNTTFIYYAKTITLAEAFGLFQIPPSNQPVPTKRDGKFKGWADFLDQTQEYTEEVQGHLEGLPRGSKQLGLRSKSVPGQPEMIRLNPATTLAPGEYQIGIRSGLWYRFTVTGRPMFPSGTSSPSSATSQRSGPPIRPRAEGPSTTTPAFQCPPEVLQNPAWPTVSKAMEASGGVASILRAGAVKTRLTGRAYVEGQGFVSLSTLVYSKYPDQLRQEGVYQLKSGRVDQTLSFDKGETRGFSRGKPFTPANATKEALRNEVFMQNAEGLRLLLEGKCRFTTNANVVVNGKSYPSVTVSDRSFEVTLLFDPDTSLLVQRRFSKLDQKGKLVSVAVVYSKHAQFGGLMVPGHVEGYENGVLRHESDLQEVTFLEDVPDVYFSDPSRGVP